MNKSDLARLTDALIVRESSGAEQLGALRNVVEQADVEEETGAGCAGATFA